MSELILCFTNFEVQSESDRPRMKIGRVLNSETKRYLPHAPTFIVEAETNGTDWADIG
jgi:hypothetical protein